MVQAGTQPGVRAADRVTGDKVRLLNCRLTQIQWILEINTLVEEARESLVMGRSEACTNGCLCSEEPRVLLTWVGALQNSVALLKSIGDTFVQC